MQFKKAINISVTPSFIVSAMLEAVAHIKELQRRSDDHLNIDNLISKVGLLAHAKPYLPALIQMATVFCLCEWENLE